MLNAACLMIMIATSALLVWSGIRAWRINNALLRWSGTSLAVLSETAVSLLSVLTVIGLLRLQVRSAPVPNLKIAGRPAQIRRGQAIDNSFSIVSVALAIQKPAASPAAWTSARSFLKRPSGGGVHTLHTWHHFASKSGVVC